MPRRKTIRTTDRAERPTRTATSAAGHDRAHGLQSLQRQIGNRAVARLISGEHEAAAQHSAHPDARRAGGDHGSRSEASAPRLNRSPVLQRTIKVDGKEYSTAKLWKAILSKKARVIAANWALSSIDHDFRSVDKLGEALAKAMAQTKAPPALFQAANLKFLTKADERLPTLYFKSGGNSGRLRQQHGSGPAVVEESGKVDYFFASKRVMKYFSSRLYAWGNRDRVERRLVKYGGTTTPTAGYAHLEVTYSGQDIVKRHPSGGLIDVATVGYDDDAITAIYQRVTGQAY
jgi:hypothetical protein